MEKTGYAIGIAVTEQRSAVKSETIASWFFWSYSSRLHSVTNSEVQNQKCEGLLSSTVLVLN